MSSLPTLPVNIRHVAWQFARRAPLDAAQFLYGEIAQRMLQRLSYIRVSPDLLLDAGCGAGHAIEPLRARYPAAGYMGVDHCATLLDVARTRHAGKRGLWNRLRNNPVPKTEFMCADMASIPLPPEQADLIWSNMALHWHDQPHAVLAEWRRLLRPDGVVMFSCLGPATFKELRSALQSAGLETATPEFVDMHDFGDLLIESGFADPVMDQEILTLTYRTPEKLLEDLRHLGGNPHPARRKGLAGRQWRQRLLDALEKQRHPDGTIHLTLEIAYGHAWRARSWHSAPGETRISASAIKRQPKP